MFVFAPDPLLTVTIEAGPDGDEIHLHAGGQGFWTARMAASLGATTTLGGPFGGETGNVVQHLMGGAGITLSAVATAGANGAYVHDRRGGERIEVSAMSPQPLSRHDVDDLYGAALTAGLESDVTVLAGPGPWQPAIVPRDIYRRLAGDLRANNRRVVADLSGEALTEALAGGLTVLKVSHEELLRDGYTPGDDVDSLLQALESLRAAGAEHVVVSRAGEPALALLEDRVVEVHGPDLAVVDHRGAGDSMTAGIAAGLALGLDLNDALRLGSAAGALNVTRRGLASGDRDAIESMAEQFELREIDRRARVRQE